MKLRGMGDGGGERRWLIIVDTAVGMPHCFYLFTVVACFGLCMLMLVCECCKMMVFVSRLYSLFHGLAKNMEESTNNRSLISGCHCDVFYFLFIYLFHRPN